MLGSGTRMLALAGFAFGAFYGTAFADPCEAPLPARGTAFSGTVRYIVDGDGFCVGHTADPNEWIEVRVADFYAPELKTPKAKPRRPPSTRSLWVNPSSAWLAGRATTGP